MLLCANEDNDLHILGRTENVLICHCLSQRSSTLLLGTHSPGKFIPNLLQHTCLQLSSSLELDWPLQVFD